MAKNNKKQFQNKRTEKKQYTPPVRTVSAAEQEEMDREFMEKYSQGGIIKNVLKIWRDSSRIGFITYFPVILLEFIYCIAWFVVSILTFFSATQEFGLLGRDAVIFINTVIVSVGLPLLLSYLHLRYNIKNKRWYFTNALRYILPACLIYLVLDFLNLCVAVMFMESAGEAIMAKLETSLVMGLVAVVAIAVFGCIGQILLIWKRNKAEPLSVRLAVGTRHNFDDKD
ncbi:MAG: hypothetical protein IKU55_05175 [Clostridia bacterium]|nr:hypothetical protein [Clostridia bacterium]